MKKIIKKVKENDYSLEDMLFLKEKIFSIFDEFEKLEGYEKITILPFLGKISFYKLNFKIYEIKKDKNIAKKIIKNILEDLPFLEKANKQELEYLEELKEDKNILFSKKNEILIVTESKYGFYLIANTPGNLKVFNLVHEPNGFHIFENGSFCSGDTYANLKNILEEGSLSSFVILLKKILTDFDDKRYHLAKPSDFKNWQKIREENQITLSDRKKRLIFMNKKIEFLKKHTKLSEESINFIDERIALVEDEIRQIPLIK